MKIRFFALVFSFLTLTVHSQSFTVKSFNKKVSKLGLQFKMPEGFHTKEAVPNRDLQYSFAIINSDSTLEIRYSLFPLKPFLEKYKKDEKAKKVTINPDSIYIGLMKTNGLTMTKGILPEIKTVPLDKAKVFNADFAGTNCFDFMCEFGKGYKYGQFLCLHKRNKADVIITFMSNDIKIHSDLIKGPFYALTFK
jgi:hypothetical protein